ncbi:MAG: aldo/keto reductase family oxidoreductase [Cyclobacteriaceae bacterium]|jgi:predicted oxidoreductase
MMQRDKLHGAGPEFSRLIAGVWRWHTVSPETVDRLVHTALDHGISTFDHADIYGDHGNEEIFGQLLKRQPALRGQMELVTKCGIKLVSARRPATRLKHYDTSRDHIFWSVENSLSALGTDYLDLLLIHRPDPLLNPVEVAEAFGDLKAQGKVLHFGVSNFTPSQFNLLQQALPFPLVTNQIEISLSRVDPLFNGELDNLMLRGARAMAWSPLGGGKRVGDERDWFAMAAKYNASYGQLALAWLLRHPSGIFPIVGTTQPDRVAEAAKGISVELDRQDWFDMLRWATGREVA